MSFVLPDVLPSDGVSAALPSEAAPASVLAVIVLDRSAGHHVRRQVREGRFELNSHMKKWEDTRKELEGGFVDFATEKGLNPNLPWNMPGASGRSTRNICKCLYMHLLTMFGNGIVSLGFDNTASPEGGDGKAFFQIACVNVYPHKRAEFDSGMFPTISSLRQSRDPAVVTRMKTLFKWWQTAGFDETFDPVNGVLFKYNPATYAKQKGQQSRRRKE